MTMDRTDMASPTGTTLRMVLLVLSAAALIGGSFMSWINFGQIGDLAEAFGQDLPSTAGVTAPISIFWSTSQTGDPSFFTSAGFVTLILGVLALVGIAVPWLARLAGALGVIAFVLFVITIYRTPEFGPGLNFGIGNVGLGMWVILAGSVLALVAGFVRGERTVVTTTSAPPPPAEP